MESNDNLPEPTREPLTPQALYDIYRDVVPVARDSLTLAEPFASEPAYQAALALWKCILHPGKSNHTRMMALKEYHDRILGKVFSASEGSKPLGGNLDLSLLSDDELATLTLLLKKAEKKDPGDGS